jgi:hypothetical protein
MPDRIKTPAAFWLGVDRLNIRRSALLRAAGLPAQAGQENSHLTAVQFFALWQGLEALQGPDVGLHLAQSLDSAVMPPSFLVGNHARDLGDALFEGGAGGAEHVAPTTRSETSGALPTRTVSRSPSHRGNLVTSDAELMRLAMTAGLGAARSSTVLFGEEPTLHLPSSTTRATRS